MRKVLMKTIHPISGFDDETLGFSVLSIEVVEKVHINKF